MNLLARIEARLVNLEAMSLHVIERVEAIDAKVDELYESVQALDVDNTVERTNGFIADLDLRIDELFDKKLPSIYNASIRHRNSLAGQTGSDYLPLQKTVRSLVDITRIWS